jgi:ferredoxin
MPKVSFEMESVAVDIAPGQTIYDAARKAGIVLTRGFAEARGACGGKGFCSGFGCAVFLRAPDPTTAVSPPTWKERWLHRKLLKNRKRLACQCSPLRDLTVVTIP